MLPFHSNAKQSMIDKKVSKINQSLEKVVLSKSLQSNISAIKKLFKDNNLLITRNLTNKNDSAYNYAITYCDGLADKSIINENIIKPLILSDVKISNAINDLIEKVLLIDDVKSTNTIKDIVTDITYGDTILFIDGISDALILNTKLLEKRTISEPENEKALVGPREGFTEALLTNLSLISRKVRTNDLKFKYVTLGDRSNTRGCICYLDSIVNKNALTEFEKRLGKIKIDGLLDTNYITELTKDNPYSPFRTTGYSEKPDVIVGKLLEGRIAFALDGTPMVITFPYLFIENFQNSEDYYLSYYYTSFSRMVRILGFFLTITVPAFYIAIVVYHKEMLPVQLFINIALERQGVPLPAALEAFIMLIVFDTIRETGIRMPSNIGQTLSVVGAIVIGQALVQAKLVAAPMIIVVAFTGITSLLVPKLNSPIIFIRLMLLILSSTLGLFGFISGLSILLIHIFNLNSFSVSQTPNIGKGSFQNMKDTFFRAPWWKMKDRPTSLSKNAKRFAQAGVKYK
jgi:spore germination protein KA